MIAHAPHHTHLHITQVAPNQSVVGVGGLLGQLRAVGKQGSDLRGLSQGSKGHTSRGGRGMQGRQNLEAHPPSHPPKCSVPGKVGGGSNTHTANSSRWCARHTPLQRVAHTAPEESWTPLEPLKPLSGPGMGAGIQPTLRLPPRCVWRKPVAGLG